MIKEINTLQNVCNSRGGGYKPLATDEWNHLTFIDPVFTNHGFEVCSNCQNIELCNFGETWGAKGAHVRVLGVLTFKWPYNLTGGTNCQNSICSFVGQPPNNNPNYHQYWFYWNGSCGDAGPAPFWGNMSYNSMIDISCKHKYNDTYYLTAPSLFALCDPCQASCCDGVNEPIINPTPCTNNYRTRDDSVSLEIISDGISPNPIHDIFQIQSPEIIETVKLYDVNGILIKQMSNLNIRTYSYNMSDLSPGVYLIVINNKRHYKLVKI